MNELTDFYKAQGCFHPKIEGPIRCQFCGELVPIETKQPMCDEAPATSPLTSEPDAALREACEIIEALTMNALGWTDSGESFDRARAFIEQHGGK